MKKPVSEYTYAEIEKRLAFAAKLEALGLQSFGKEWKGLPPHLEKEKQELLTEKYLRPETWSF